MRAGSYQARGIAIGNGRARHGRCVLKNIELDPLTMISMPTDGIWPVGSLLRPFSAMFGDAEVLLKKIDQLDALSFYLDREGGRLMGTLSPCRLIIFLHIITSLCFSDFSLIFIVMYAFWIVCSHYSFYPCLVLHRRIETIHPSGSQ